jgi:hypothetical protein
LKNAREKENLKYQKKVIMPANEKEIRKSGSGAKRKN